MAGALPKRKPSVRSGLQAAGTRGLRVAWGRGRKEGTLYPMIDAGDASQYTLSVCTGTGHGGYVQFQFPNMTPPFDVPTRRAELIDRLNRALDLSLPEDAKYPMVPLSELAPRVDRLELWLEHVMEATRRRDVLQ